MSSDRPPSKGDKPADKDHRKLDQGDATAATPRAAASKGVKSGGKPSESKKERDEAMGAALRSVYQTAASEPVPDQMLDLLKQLG